MVRLVPALCAGVALTALNMIPTQAAPGAGHYYATWRVAYRAHGSQARLPDIVAIAPGDAWAIGYPGQAAGTNRGYALNWNGRKWRVVSFPPNFFPSTVETTPNYRVWVAGLQYGGSAPHPAAVRWNGGGWSSVTLPSQSSLALLAGTQDAWATAPANWTGRTGWRRAAYLWNGASWSKRFQLPSLGDGYALTASPTGTVWAFGSTTKALSNGDGALVAYRWTGSRWRAVRMGHVMTWDGVFGASVGSARNLWLVTASIKSSHQMHQLRYWHWNGRRLTRLPAPDPPVASAFDESVTVADDGHGGAWFQPAEHWTGKRWRYPLRDYRCPGFPLWLDEAPVPHSWSAWATDSCQASGPKAGSFIDVNGPLP